MFKRIFLNDNLILLLIITNAVIIFISGFDLGERNNLILSLIDNSVSILFIVELALKFKEYGVRFFSSNWNKFDFILILLSVPALLSFIFKTDLLDFGFLLIFRVLRVFKSFRFLKFIPGIDHLIRGIKRALKSSIIVILGFIVYIFIIGIFSFYLFKESSPEYFSNPFISLYSTFKIFTIEGWFEIPEQVTYSFSPIVSFFIYLYFIFVVLSGGILGLSLVNSIFVDAMVSDNNDELEKKIERLEKKIDMLVGMQKKG
jgi:voltage-gated sodium channel